MAQDKNGQAQHQGPQSQAQNDDREEPEGLPPIAEGIEDAIGNPPRETVSGDPAYAPDPEFAAMKDADESSERD